MLVARAIRYALAVGFLAGSAACGTSSDVDPSRAEEIGAASSSSPSGKPKNSAPRDTAFSLTDAAEWTIQVTGCASGYTATITQAATRTNLYKGDIGCEGRLISFTHNGKAFGPAPNQGFPNYQPGARAKFVSADLLTTMDVKVVSQLSSPLQANDAIDYGFTQPMGAASSSSKLFDVIIGADGKAGNGAQMPKFTVTKVELINVIPARGAAQYKIFFQCTQRLKKPTIPGQVECAGVRLNELNYLLTKDTFNGVPCTNSNVTPCRNLFTPSATRAVDTSTDVIQPGTNGLTNGGFVTKVTAALALTSPDNVAANPNMLGVIAQQDLAAFQYFNLDVDTSVDLYLSEVAALGLADEE